MRRLVVCYLLLIPLALVLVVSPLRSQPPRDPTEHYEAAQRDDADNQRRGQPRGGARRGFPFPPPPLLTALDTDKDGTISAEELKNSHEALRRLDRNDDGMLAGDELRPAFGPGGPPFGRGRGGRRGGFNPFGGGDADAKRIAPEDIKFKDGVANIADHATFHQLSYRGEEVMIDTFLSGLEFVKFTLDQATSDARQLYFINTKTHRAHMMFARVAGIPIGRGEEQMKGVLVYRPTLKSPSGQPGLYTFEFEPFDAYPFEMVKLCQNLLMEKMPILEGNLGYYPRGDRAIAAYEKERSSYDGLEVVIYLDEDLNKGDVGYLPLNLGVTFGRLRLMQIDERPSPRDVVLYKTLPNELPRVAGIITAVRQTPLSHVNLRAVQDKVPNAYITDAADNETIQALLGKYVAYSVTPDGYAIREATQQEVDGHFADLRPTDNQVPPRDLAAKTIHPLGEVGFDESSSFGVKAANLATLRTFGFPRGTVPDGFAVPFYFYDEFMKHNGFYDYASELLEHSQFRENRKTQEAQLKKFRTLIKKGNMPSWMMLALDDLHQSFPAGTSLRCRSSTNNEDLPGFSGAGLYDSCTQHPDEGHLSKSIKQVYGKTLEDENFAMEIEFKVTSDGKLTIKQARPWVYADSTPARKRNEESQE